MLLCDPRSVTTEDADQHVARTTADQPLIIRNRSNYVSGWFLGVGGLALNVAIDALHLYSRFSDAPNETAVQALPLYLFWVAIGMGAFGIFARPRVEVGPDQVILRNVFRDIYIPTASIEDIDDSGKYLTITAGGRRFVAAATEASNLTVMLGRQGTAHAVEEALEQGPQGATTSTSVRISVRQLPHRGEAVLWIGYLAYAVAAIAHQLLS